MEEVRGSVCNKFTLDESLGLCSHFEKKNNLTGASELGLSPPIDSGSGERVPAWAARLT